MIVQSCARPSLSQIFLFKQKTAYEMRISDWSSDVCSSDLTLRSAAAVRRRKLRNSGSSNRCRCRRFQIHRACCRKPDPETRAAFGPVGSRYVPAVSGDDRLANRSEEHTSELQSLMRISYAVFCLKKKK